MLDETLLDFRHIALRGWNEVISVDDCCVAWGNQVLQGLNLDDLGDYQKAGRICEYVHAHITYSFSQRRSISEILRKKGGNCVSHALVGIFLLRLAGIPAKIAHEVHITREYTPISLYVGIWARRNNNGINSFWHNDHVWIFFKSEKGWQPFDSALNLYGFDMFYRKRFYCHKQLAKGLAQKWTGPPFVIWEETGTHLPDIRNVTTSVVNSETMKPIAGREEWMEFVDLFAEWRVDEFTREYLPEQMISRIKSISRRWFSGCLGN